LPAAIFLHFRSYARLKKHRIWDIIRITKHSRGKTPMCIVIKKMETEEEIRGKAVVAWRSWHEAYPGLVRQEYLDSLTLEKCEKAAFRMTEGFLVAKDNDRVVGFIACAGREDASPKYGEIVCLYVLSEYYGKGVGRRLMEAGWELMKEYPKICLWVLKENKRAFRFYQKCGFYPDGEEIFSAKHGAVEIRMTLDLAQHRE